MTSRACFALYVSAGIYSRWLSGYLSPSTEGDRTTCLGTILWTATVSACNTLSPWTEASEISTISLRPWVLIRKWTCRTPWIRAHLVSCHQVSPLTFSQRYILLYSKRSTLSTYLLFYYGISVTSLYLSRFFSESSLFIIISHILLSIFGSFDHKWAIQAFKLTYYLAY